MKLLIFIIGIGIGIACVIYNRKLVQSLGPISWAERTFGAGGSYLMWQLIGLAIIVLTLFYVTGIIERILGSIISSPF